MQYILGLGNPEDQYEDTRHNVGRMLVRSFARNGGFTSFSEDKHARALRAEGVVEGVPAAALLPETYMNRSGETVSYLKSKEGAEGKHLIVVFDDVNLPFGDVRISWNRGDGGHNGIRSIVAALGNKEFIQVRVGISPVSFWTGKMKRPEGAQLASYVLARFGKSELSKLKTLEPRLRDILHTITKDGVERAMNKFN